ncbi:MAG: hypothetical protein R3C56_36815 [Pirellulaceae bacterium]
MEPTSAGGYRATGLPRARLWNLFGNDWNRAIAAAWILPIARSRYSSESILLASQWCFAGVLLLIGSWTAAWVILPSLLLIGAVGWRP